MAKENKFENMMTNALSNVDETLEDIKENTMSENPYKLNQALINEGFISSNDGVYVPFKAYFQSIGVEDSSTFNTRDDIYLFIMRNPDKKLEIKCKWAKKTSEGFHKTRGFNLDFSLDIGDEKTLKALNKKVSFSGGKNGNPASEGTYVEFVDYFTNLIIDNDCLQVLKEDTFDFPEILDDEDIDDDDEIVKTPQSFSDYPEKIQHEAMQILNEGKLFQEMSKSVSITHEGHKTTRNALILMETSLFVDDGAHGLLGGESGGGKTDIALTCALNLPQKNVHIISSNSPKDIFYDFDSYDDDFNILIFDDILFNDELIKLCKLLSDNRVKEKVHKTVINGKAVKFKLKGKYEIIITYAKTLPDEELANRLFNIGVNIVDEGESDNFVKHKILDNNITKGNDNELIKEIRLPIRAGIQYLLEQDMRVFNPYLSIYNPINYNNRDINHLTSMTNARTFFEYTQRRQLKVNENLSLTIGSLEDLMFVHDIWARDGDAQKYKLSERQKQILDILPEMTSEDAFDKIDEINEDLKSQSRAYKKTLMDKQPFAKSLARQLKCNVSTLKHDLDRVSEGTHKSLLEIGLVDKIQLDEDNPKSPNFYYKIKSEKEVLNHENNYVQDSKIQFAHSFNSSIVKQRLIIDLLIYANITISERGICTLQKYCEDEHVELNANDYDGMLDFLQGFFDIIDDEKDFIKSEESSRDDKMKMFDYKAKLVKQLQKETHNLTPSKTSKICTSKNQEENSSNDNQDKNNMVNQDITNIVNNYIEFEDTMKEKHIDVEIAQQVYEHLSSGAMTLEEITRKLCEGLNPDDIDNSHIAMKIDNHVNRLYMNDYLDFNVNKYELKESFIKLARGE